MASGRIDTMDIHELIRLFRAGDSDPQIARCIGYNLRTVARYRSWASEQGLLEGELPPVADLHRRLTTTLPTPLPLHQVSSVAPYAEEIAQLSALLISLSDPTRCLRQGGWCVTEGRDADQKAANSPPSAGNSM